MKGRMRVRVFVVAAVLVAGLSGCSVLGLGDPEVKIAFYSDVPIPAGTVLQVSIGENRYNIRAGSHVTAQQYRMDGKAPGSGTYLVSVAVVDSSGASLGRLQFEQRFDDGYVHWVSGEIRKERPWGICIGQVTASPLRPGYFAGVQDTLFVAHGRLRKNAIC